MRVMLTSVVCFLLVVGASAQSPKLESAPGTPAKALEAKVRDDIARTGDSLMGRLACRLEERLLARGVRLPFGIRGLTVLSRPRQPS